jgi:hypothetical protein
VDLSNTGANIAVGTGISLAERTGKIRPQANLRA